MKWANKKKVNIKPAIFRSGAESIGMKWAEPSVHHQRHHNADQDNINEPKETIGNINYLNDVIDRSFKSNPSPRSVKNKTRTSDHRLSAGRDGLPGIAEMISTGIV